MWLHKCGLGTVTGSRPLSEPSDAVPERMASKTDDRHLKPQLVDRTHITVRRGARARSLCIRGAFPRTAASLVDVDVDGRARPTRRCRLPEGGDILVISYRRYCAIMYIACVTWLWRALFLRPRSLFPPHSALCLIPPLPPPDLTLLPSVAARWQFYIQ